MERIKEWEVKGYIEFLDSLTYEQGCRFKEYLWEYWQAILKANS